MQTREPSCRRSDDTPAPEYFCRCVRTATRSLASCTPLPACVVLSCHCVALVSHAAAALTCADVPGVLCGMLDGDARRQPAGGSSSEAQLLLACRAHQRSARAGRLVDPPKATLLALAQREGQSFILVQVWPATVIKICWEYTALPRVMNFPCDEHQCFA